MIIEFLFRRLFSLFSFCFQGAILFFCCLFDFHLYSLVNFLNFRLSLSDFVPFLYSPFNFVHFRYSLNDFVDYFGEFVINFKHFSNFQFALSTH